MRKSPVVCAVGSVLLTTLQFVAGGAAGAFLTALALSLMVLNDVNPYNWIPQLSPLQVYALGFTLCCLGLLVGYMAARDRYRRCLGA